MNNGNLKRGNPATQFQSGSGSGRGAVENGRKSGEARRRKAAIRKAVTALLLDVQPDSGGLTGEEMLAAALFATACDPNNRNQVNAARLIVHLIGQDVSPLDEKEQRARIEKLKADLRRAEEVPAVYAAADDPITEAIRAAFH